MSKLNYIARRAIEKGLKDGKTDREIAKEIGISKSTVGYEIKQYKPVEHAYHADLAHWKGQQRAHSKNKKRCKSLQPKQLLIIDKLIRARRSPKDISLYLRRIYPEQKHLQISHESIHKLAYGFANIAGYRCGLA